MLAVRLILSQTHTKKPRLRYKDIFCHKNMVRKYVFTFTQKFIIDFDVTEQINRRIGRSFHFKLLAFSVAVTQIIVIYNLVKVTEITRG